ncbi:putative Zinc finger, BED-type [Corchorus capsularis]|uniref:Putative Zinc finger, BED-type n=1 Tax=Corchorus capsularis TaxID=210143 RepID=A0A1R3H6B9_COCAP|nr:putative Zinc finger, BED-type [Corchorus capsularis]
MELNLTPVSINKHKQDPAWNHCEAFKNGDRVQIKCMYCGKMFKGGGIHRFKEHLAGKKGQCPSCEQVPQSVRAFMLESLNGRSKKQDNKQKTLPDLFDSGNCSPYVGEIDLSAFHDDVNNGIKPNQVLNTLAPSSDLVATEKEEVSQGSRDSRKRGRSKSLLVNSESCAKSSDLALVSKGVENPVQFAIGRFLFDIGVNFEAVNSVYFQPMIDAIASAGSGTVPPSCQELRGSILKSVIEEVKHDIDRYKATWKKTGCSILVEQWSLKNGRTFLNFLVYCPQATVFLKSVDASHVFYSVDHLYELLKQVVEEVGVENVLQVITNCEQQYFLTGKMLMESFPSLYWAPSMAHCVDMMLEDFGNIEWINETIAQAKSVTRFVYNHSVILNMMRRFTFGNDIVEPAVTRSATNFVTLQRMADLKLNLQTMINSQDWLECQYAKKPGGQVMVDIVRNRSFWNSCVLIVRLTYPLLKVLEIAGSKKSSAMGYVYAGIYRAKETIKKELVKKDDYMVYWNIIDHRWEQQRHLPLYAAGFFLNPKFFYSSEGNIQSDILSSMFDCIERLVPDINIQDRIIKEIHLYKNASGDLGRPIAVRARDNLLPGKDSYTVQLVLRNQEKDSVDPLSVDSKDVLEDWIADNVVGLEDYGSSDWTTLDPPVGNRMVSGSSGDEIEDFLGTGFADLDIFSGLKGVKQDI